MDGWAGGIPETCAQVPWIRIGRRWFSTWWLLPMGILALVLSSAAVRELSTTTWYNTFTTTYPGTTSDYVPPVNDGCPTRRRWQHFVNLLFKIFIIHDGLQILAVHPRLCFRSGSTPDTEWLRMREPIPADRRDSNDADHMWMAKDDSVALPKHVDLPGFRHSIGLAR